MTWPTTRLTTYTAGSQVKSADLDAIQDTIIAGGHGDQSLVTPWEYRQMGSGVASNVFAFDESIGAFATPGANTNLMSFGRLRVGDRLKSASFYLYGDGTTDASIDIFLGTFNPAAMSNLGSQSVTNQVAAWSLYGVTLGTPHVLAAGEYVIAKLEFSTVSGANVGPIQWIYDHP